VNVSRLADVNEVICGDYKHCQVMCNRDKRSRRGRVKSEWGDVVAREVNHVFSALSVGARYEGGVLCTPACSLATLPPMGSLEAGGDLTGLVNMGVFARTLESVH
jgi:hypothetical protein